MRHADGGLLESRQKPPIAGEIVRAHPLGRVRATRGIQIMKAFPVAPFAVLFGVIVLHRRYSPALAAGASNIKPAMDRAAAVKDARLYP
jgi:hypothetical protein